MSRVPFRVHGPYLHRQRWRLDVFDHGERRKLSFATYAEALLAVAAMASGRGNGSGNTSGAAIEEDR